MLHWGKVSPDTVPAFGLALTADPRGCSINKPLALVGPLAVAEDVGLMVMRTDGETRAVLFLSIRTYL